MNAGAVSVKVLGVLTAVVVMAHLVVLQHSPRTVQTLPHSPAQSFSTRSIASTPPPVPTPTLTPTPTPAGKNQIAPVAPSALAAPARPRTTRPVQHGTFTDITTIGPAEAMAFATPSAIDLPSPIATETAAGETAPSDGSATAAAPVPAVAESSQSPTSRSTPTVTAAAGDVTVAAADKVVPKVVASAAAASSSAPSTATSPAVNLTFALPGSIRLKYNVVATKGSLNFNARSELLWQQDGSNYDLRLEVSAFLLGSRVQTSTGRVTSAGLAPTRFADKVRTEVAAHFERDRQLVIFSANTPQIALLAGMQDQLSVFIQLGAMIAGAPAKYPAGTVLVFETIGPRSGEKWVLTVGEEEKLNLPGGDLAALKLTRSPRGEYDQTLEFWLAPQWGYLPARIKLTEKNGDYADQVWRATESP